MGSEIIEEVSSNTQGRRWILTINNPDKTDEEYETYIRELEHFKYAMFQREKGHETGTEHIQLFVIFTIGKRFNTVKNYFPKAHIEQAKGTNIQCRDYCSKKDTRISGPYEVGQFAEERQRTDKQGFLQLARAGVSDKEIMEMYPSLYLDNHSEIDALYRKALRDDFENKYRNVKVTYIYGPTRSGKTSFVFNKYRRDEFYRVTLYNNSAFEGYKNQKVIVFDEFNSSLKITDMNHYLDRYYVDLPARYGNRFAVYEEVYIISNLSLSKQYVDEQDRKPEIYDAFIKRIDNIIRIDYSGIHVEKGLVEGVQQEMELTEMTEEEKRSLPL